MSTALLVALPLLTAYLLGSLPLGAWLIRAASGFDPRDVNPHLLGVENVYKLIGPQVATASFALDMLKGATGAAFGALLGAWAGGGVGSGGVAASLTGDLLSAAATAPAALALSGGMALVGVIAGHLYPLPIRRLKSVPRGRGNGVLIGALGGLFALGALPFWMPLAAAAVFAATLAGSGYAALASVMGVLTLGIMGGFGSILGYVNVAVGSSLIVVAALMTWRNKAGLSRINDGTEPKLGAPPPVKDLDQNTVLCAFMLHPLTYDDVWQPRSAAWTKWVVERLVKPGLLPEAWLKRLFLNIRPQLHGVIEGVRLPDGRAMRVLLISAPLMPDQFSSHPDEALKIAIKGARFAHQLGAGVVGLGAFWSTVGDKGERVQEAVPEIQVTNGGAYTAATVRAAVPGLLERFAEEGGNLRAASAAVVGANGVVAFGVARMIADEVGELILVGRDRERLMRSAETLRRKYSRTRIHATTDVSEVEHADLIFTATSDPDPVIFAHHVKPGAWVYDLGRPADVDEGVRSVPGVELVPGGVVRPPGGMRTRIDLRFGDGNVPACLAETMILTATGEFGRKSLGNRTSQRDIEFYLSEAQRLGFEIVTEGAKREGERVSA